MFVLFTVSALLEPIVLGQVFCKAPCGGMEVSKQQSLVELTVWQGGQIADNNTVL